MVGHRSSFVTIFLWISLLSSSLHEAWCRPKEAFPSHKNGVAASSLNFMVVGDWGGQDDPPYYTDPEQDVAKQMGDIAASMGAQFTLSMGDNFYDNGVSYMTVALVFMDTIIILAGKSHPKDMFSSPDGPDSQQAADNEW